VVIANPRKTAARTPSDVDVPKGVEPERLDVIREYRAAAEYDGGKNRQDDHPAAVLAGPSRGLPVDDARRLGHGQKFTFLRMLS
jgi:hypothetical protein